MEIFGWIMLILLALFGAFMVGLMIGPFVVAKIRSFGYKMHTFIEDEKVDADKRSDQRRNRQELKRQRDFELANKKLDVKLSKVDKKIKIQSEKLKLSQDLEKQLAQESKELKGRRDDFVVGDVEKTQPRNRFSNQRDPIVKTLPVREQRDTSKPVDLAVVEAQLNQPATILVDEEEDTNKPNEL